jgi:hypothetical protein
MRCSMSAACSISGVVEPIEALVRQQQARLRRERARQLELLQRGRAKPVGGDARIGRESDQRSASSA